MQSILAIIVAVLQIIGYILKNKPSKTKPEIIAQIWSDRKVKRDEAIIKNKDDQVSMDASDIIDGIHSLPKKDPGSPQK